MSTFSLNAGTAENPRYVAARRKGGGPLALRSFDDAMRVAKLVSRRLGLHVRIERDGRLFATTGAALRTMAEPVVPVVATGEGTEDLP